MDNCKCKKAVPIPTIPHTVIATRFDKDGKDLTKCYPGYYVEVRDENTVYHVFKATNSCVINSLPVSRNFVFKDNYNPAAHGKYRNNIVIDFSNDLMYVFDYQQNYRTIALTNPEEEE